jgi:predicted protein tyrosine phosphatase
MAEFDSVDLNSPDFSQCKSVYSNDESLIIRNPKRSDASMHLCIDFSDLFQKDECMKRIDDEMLQQIYNFSSLKKDNSLSFLNDN